MEPRKCMPVKLQHQNKQQHTVNANKSVLSNHTTTLVQLSLSHSISHSKNKYQLLGWVIITNGMLGADDSSLQAEFGVLVQGSAATLLSSVQRSSSERSLSQWHNDNTVYNVLIM